jgi:DNA-binding GntR family transcriptional regulator
LRQSIEELRGLDSPLQLWPTGDQLRALSVKEHRLILEAVASRDAPAAEQAMVVHLESVRSQARHLSEA